jgi:hypothetical protein
MAKKQDHFQLPACLDNSSISEMLIYNEALMNLSADFSVSIEETILKGKRNGEYPCDQ